MGTFTGATGAETAAFSAAPEKSPWGFTGVTGFALLAWGAGAESALASKPVAMTVTLISSSMLGSKVAPKMMFASG